MLVIRIKDCQTLSKGFEIPRNRSLTLTTGLLSNAVLTSCINESSWEMHDSPSKTADCEGVKRTKGTLF